MANHSNIYHFYQEDGHKYYFYAGARNSTYVEGSNAFFMERASLSSLPFAIDDPPKAGGRGGGFDISDLIVDLYNGCKTANLKAESLRPLSTAIIATKVQACILLS